MIGIREKLAGIRKKKCQINPNLVVGSHENFDVDLGNTFDDAEIIKVYNKDGPMKFWNTWGRYFVRIPVLSQYLNSEDMEFFIEYKKKDN